MQNKEAWSSHFCLDNSSGISLHDCKLIGIKILKDKIEFEFDKLADSMRLAFYWTEYGEIDFTGQRESG